MKPNVVNNIVGNSSIMPDNFCVKAASSDATAIVHLDKKHVDPETFKQIVAITGHSSVSHVRIMPDCHKGNGCCIGFTGHLGATVVPGLIGGDIGCGIAAFPLPAAIMSHKKSCERVDRTIKAAIPMGNGRLCVHSAPIIEPEQYAPFFASAQSDAAAFVSAYNAKFGVDLAPWIPTYSYEWYCEMSCRVGSDINYDMCAMGTLGGSNHYIEVDASDANYYLTVHTGSRNLGYNIARYHSNVMNGIKHSASTLDGPDDEDAATFNVCVSGLSGEQAAAYFFDMIWAQTWAKMNRRAILSIICGNLGIPFDTSLLIESVHNYIDFTDLVIRKGAISAHTGASCIISLNMRDGILICKGAGNPEWNMSGPHGCGRIVGRRAASGKSDKKSVAVAMRKFEAEMDGVYSTCIVPETLDERPSVYRDADIIKDAIGETVEIVEWAKTVVNVKGT